MPRLTVDAWLPLALSTRNPIAQSASFTNPTWPDPLVRRFHTFLDTRMSGRRADTGGGEAVFEALDEPDGAASRPSGAPAPGISVRAIRLNAVGRPGISQFTKNRDRFFVSYVPCRH